MRNIDDKLINLFNEINRREKLKIHLAHLDEMIQIKEKEKELLAITLAKEERDVVDLENLTIYSLFSTILGTREAQLEKERQEYLHALMLYHGVEELGISLTEERNLLIKSLNGLHVVDREFDRLLLKKDKLLKKMETYPKELVTLNERIASFNMQIREINSALDKGNVSKKSLHKIMFNLKRIKKWGFEGRHYDSSSMLHKTKSVQNNIYIVNNLLQKYEDQLYDISVHYDINLDNQIKHFDSFLDRFVDSLITDWIVNNKIENSIHWVNNMADTITKLNGSLEYHRNKIQIFLEEDEELKGQMILELINKNKS